MFTDVDTTFMTVSDGYFPYCLLQNTLCSDAKYFPFTIVFSFRGDGREAC